MKINSFIIIIILFLLNTGIKAQLSSFQWSEGIEKNDNRFLKIISFAESTVVVFKPEGSNIRLDFFDAANQKTNKIVAFKGKYLDVLRVGESVVLFTAVFDGYAKKNQLYAKILNNNNSEDALVLDQALVGKLHSKFKVNVSPDFNHVIVLTEKPHRKGKKEDVVFSVLDKGLKVQRTIPYLMNSIYSQKRRINVPIINNNGEVYVLKRYRVSNKSSYYVLSYSKSGNVRFKEFKLNYKPVQDAQYLLDNDGSLIVGGTYTSQNSSRSEGIYIAKFDIEGNMIFRKEYGFREETMLAFTSEKSLRKEGLGLYSFSTSKLIQQKENITLVLEHRVSLANSKTGINTEKRDGLIVYSFDMEGNFVWDRALKMNQTDDTEKGYWNSYICFNDTAKNNISIVYNEVGYFDKKADNDFGESVAVGARSYVIDNQGNYKKRTIKNCFKGAPIDLVLSPKVNLQKGSSMLILAEPLDKSVYVLGVVE